MINLDIVATTLRALADDVDDNANTMPKYPFEITSKLGSRQKFFAWAVAQLLQHAYASGYAVTFGDAYRDPRVFGDFGVSSNTYSAARSVHKVRLAIDLNLFKLSDSGGFKYLTTTAAHEPLAEFWQKLGEANHVKLTWGGAWGDGNHYSMPYKGAS